MDPVDLLTDQHFLENYNTKLSPANESPFQEWLVKSGKEKDLQDYDLRGAWVNGQLAEPGSHGTDLYKKPNHPTFSDQSIYHGSVGPHGGVFRGGTWSPEGDSYTPSAEMLRSTHPLNFLQNYMKKYEPGVKLNMNRTK